AARAVHPPLRRNALSEAGAERPGHDVTYRSTELADFGSRGCVIWTIFSRRSSTRASLSLEGSRLPCQLTTAGRRRFAATRLSSPSTQQQRVAGAASRSGTASLRAGH